MPTEVKTEAPKAVEVVPAPEPKVLKQDQLKPPELVQIPEVQEELMSITAISDVLVLDSFWPAWLEKKVGRQARTKREWVSILTTNGWTI